MPIPTLVKCSDIDQPTNAVLRVFTQPKPSIFSSRAHLQEETCIGREDFRISVQPSEKVLRRITVGSNPSCQILVIYGTFVSSGAQILLDNKCLYAGYITVYIRGRLTPVCHGINMVQTIRCLLLNS